MEADLLLATGQSEAARQRYHLLAVEAGSTNWGTGQPGYYPVEPPQAGDSSGQNEGMFDGMRRSEPALPFNIGPGSHRDNSLLRRLIALDLTNDAAGEFSRLWEVHTNTQPFAVLIPIQDERGRETGEEKKLARPPGFNSFGLQLRWITPIFSSAAASPTRRWISCWSHCGCWIWTLIPMWVTWKPSRRNWQLCR